MGDEDHRVYSIEQAWRNLASDVLFRAIEEVREGKDPRKRYLALEFLKSEAAQLLFEGIFLDFDFTVSEWALKGCPNLG